MPTEFSVMVCVTGLFSEVEPKARLLALTLMVETTPVRLTTKEADVAAEVAFKVALCVAPTAETLAVNAALVAPEGMVTEAGTATFVLLLERVTANPVLGAAAESLMVQASLTNPETDALPQETALTPAVAPWSARGLNERTIKLQRVAELRFDPYMKPLP